MIAMGFGVRQHRLQSLQSAQESAASAAVESESLFKASASTAALKSANSAAQNLENYWKESGLDEGILARQLRSANCYKSEKLFLACINAVLQMSHQLELNLTPKGLVPLESGYLEKTEMEMLSPWKSIFAKLKRKKSLNLSQIWEQLKEKIPQEKLHYLTAVGMNGFYSIQIDPHSYLLPLNYYRNVLAKADPQSQGLGIILTKKKGLIYIRKVLSGSLAEQNGLKPGDQIMMINDVKITVDRKNRINDLLKVKEDQPTKLTLKRNQKTIRISINRETSEIKTVSGRYYPATKMGLITLNKFAKKTCQLVEAEIRSLKKQGAKSLLLDLRDNAGGQIDEAACMVGLFVGPKRKTFELRYFDKSVDAEVYATRKAKVFSGSLAVLINSGSASASEILAGALQDFGRAVLVGETSFGKGTFQEGEVWDLNSKIVFFQTKGLFYLPSGRSPQAHGITPDVEVASAIGESRRERDLYYNFYDVKQPQISLPRVAELSSCKSDILKMAAQGPGVSLANNEVFDLEMQTAQNTLSCLTQRVSALEARTN